MLTDSCLGVLGRQWVLLYRQALVDFHWQLL